MIAEGPVDEENYEPEEEELIPDDAVVSAAPASLEEVFQSDAEVLAAEIAAMEEEGIDQSVIDGLWALLVSDWQNMV